MNKLLSLVSLTVFVGASSIVAAAVAPDHLANRAELEVANGVAIPRTARLLTVEAPLLARRATSGQLAAGAWTTLWDRATGVASFIYGSGLEFRGSMANPAVAEAAAWTLLAEQLDILAPGANVGDFELASNHLGGGVRSVGFFQRHQGVRVVGGQVSFRFINDRLVAIASQALPNVRVDRISLAGADAAALARSWVDRDFATNSRSFDVGVPVVLPIVTSQGLISYHTAIPVTVKSELPLGKWTVYVGSDRAPVARRQLIHFATGTVNYNVSERWPGGDYANFPAAATTLSVDGANQTSNGNGVVTFNGNTAQITTSLTGPFVRISDSGNNALAVDTQTLADGGAISYGENNSETQDAQLTTYIHANIAKVYARILDPNLAWLDEQMVANVNINQTCNAFADGDTINMFRGDNQCGNTGRLADVVYHEFGHNLHINGIIPGVGDFDGALSEGASDYYAGTITDSPVMGMGFFNNEQALRHMDERDFIWPQDNTGQVHSTGRIFATTMWDVRKALIAKLGQAEGVAQADRLWYAALQRSVDIPSTGIEIIIADDDDGNLANGTPNKCEIEPVLAAHGLAPEISVAAPGLDFPVRDRYQVTVPLFDGDGLCAPPAITAVNLAWRLRGEASDREAVPMTLTGSSYVGEIPVQDEGQVIEYRVIASYEDGETGTLPRNPAAPYYEFYNGATVELYCTDFESNPLPDWSLSGAGNTWAFGPATGNAGGPPEAFSGANIFGTALAGLYAPNVNYSATTPVVDTTGHEEVRLQYHRWLNVEDSTYDQAQISANGTVLFENAKNAAGDLAHTDREWRFQDVDLSTQAATGSVQVNFGLITDAGLEFGGWNIEDVCIVAATTSECGDAQVTGNEACDDGDANSDSAPDACRTNCEAAFCGDGIVDTGEQCDDGNEDENDNCSNQCIGEGGGDGEGGGCGCQSSGSGGSGALLLFVLLGLGYIRRNRKRPTR